MSHWANSTACQCPVAAMTKDHRWSGLKQHGVILLWSGGQTSAIGLPAGTKVLLAGRRLQGRPHLLPFQLLGMLRPGHMALPCLSDRPLPPRPPHACLLFPGTPVIPWDPPGHPGSSCLSGSTAGSAKPPLPCEVTWAQAWESECGCPLSTQRTLGRGQGPRTWAVPMAGPQRELSPRTLYLWAKSGQGQRREREGVSCQSLAWNLRKGQGRWAR